MSLDYSHREVWRIALPMVISNITIPLLGLVDTFVVGHLDSEHYLAAVAVAATIFSFIFLGFNFLRMGTTGLCAQAYGQNDVDEIRRVLVRSVIIALFIATILIVFQHPISRLALLLLGPDPIVSNIAADYFSIRIYAAPASLINIVLIGWFIGLQNARTPLLLMLIINLTNIALDLLFVVHYDLKAVGVAWASLVAEYLGCCIGLLIAWQFLKQHARSSAKPHLRLSLWDSAVLTWPPFKALLKVNLDLLLRTLALQFAFAFLTAVGARQGSVILAANAVLLNFQSIISYALDGFANAAEALVGRAIGARQSKALDRAVSLSRFWSLVVALLLTALFLLGGHALINLMTDLETIRETAYKYLPWIIVSPVISVWCFLYDGVFVGAVRSREMRNIMLICTFAVFLPCWWLLQGLDNHGLWLAFVVFMGARGILMHLGWQRIRTGVVLNSK